MPLPSVVVTANDARSFVGESDFMLTVGPAINEKTASLREISMLGAFKDWFHLHYQLLKDFVPSIVALLGLGLTAVIAIAGFKSFGRWKREKIEERRIEVALDALAIAYEARFRFESIRSRFTREDEYEDIDEPSKGDAFVVITHREGQRSPYAVLKRMDNNHKFFERVFDIEPKFMAIFGAETEEIFAELYDAKRTVETAAEALYEEARIEHDPSDVDAKERMRQLRVVIFASKGKVEAEDKVGQKVLDFQRRIEALCRPIVDQTFGRREKHESP